MVSFHLVKESIENIVRLFLLTLVDILTLIRISIAYALSLVTPVHGGCTSRWLDDPSRSLRAFLCQGEHSEASFDSHDY